MHTIFIACLTMSNKVLIDRELWESVIIDLQRLHNDMVASGGDKVIDAIQSNEKRIAELLEIIEKLEAENRLFRTAYDNVYGYGSASQLVVIAEIWQDETA